MTDNERLRNNFLESSDGKQILKCIQCGTCSGSCPLGVYMNQSPRELFALIRDGMIDEALRSDAPWFCVSCYQCTVRCPKEIPVTDLMYKIKTMAIEQNIYPPYHKIPDLYRAFSNVVERDGRVSEVKMMSRYGMKHPGDAISNLPVAVRLMLKKRIHPELPI